MVDQKIVAVISNKTRIFGVIDGKSRKKDYSVKKTLWMPACLAALGFAERRARPLAFAGMTTRVGGASH
jgi:hypothetical protein